MKRCVYWVCWVTRSDERRDGLQLILKASLAVIGLMVPVGIPARLPKAKSIKSGDEGQNKQVQLGFLFLFVRFCPMLFCLGVFWFGEYIASFFDEAGSMSFSFERAGRTTGAPRLS